MWVGCLQLKMVQVVPSVSSSGPTQRQELALSDADIQLSLQQGPLKQVPLTWSDTDGCGTDGRLSYEISLKSLAKFRALCLSRRGNSALGRDFCFLENVGFSPRQCYGPKFICNT